MILENAYSRYLNEMAVGKAVQGKQTLDGKMEVGTTKKIVLSALKGIKMCCTCYNFLRKQLVFEIY